MKGNPRGLGPNRRNSETGSRDYFLGFFVTARFKWPMDTQKRTEEAPGGWQESVPIITPFYTSR
jgi:hypothetical protein